ncbi:hypothetical protein ACHFCA_26245 [Delftia tsuruhatensis]
MAALQKSFAGALTQPEVQQKFAEQGAEPRGWDPARTGQFIRAESAKWDRVIRSANVRLD